jgi:LysR family transcriptional regulator, nitrogen assimilation regulatory protein
MQGTSMDIKQLRYFIAVADLGSFSRAADALFVAQSALSRQVSELEVELGQKLFYRTGRGVILNDAGKRFYSHSRGILEQVSYAKQDLVQHGETPVGRVVLGLPFSISRIFSTRFVQSFLRSFPRAKLSIVEASSEHIIEWLAIGRMDIGLVFNPPSFTGISAKLLVDDELCLITSRKGSLLPNKENVINFRDLAKLPIIIPGNPHTLRTFVDTNLLRAKIELDIRGEIDSVPTTVDLIRKNGWCSILPRMVLFTYPDGDDLVAYRIVKPKLPFGLKIITYDKRPQSVLVRLCAELAASVISECAMP